MLHNTATYTRPSPSSDTNTKTKTDNIVSHTYFVNVTEPHLLN